MHAGYQHPGCYARILGDCSTRISREHYISKAVLKVLGDLLVIANVSWLATGDRSQPLHRNALGSRILCEKHNNELSGIDSQVAPFFRDLLDGFSVLSGSIARPTSRTERSGDMLELWLLKALAGFLSSGEFSQRGQKKTFRVPTRWLEILFNGAPWPASAGLYVRMVSAEPARALKIAPVFDPSGDPGGGGFDFCGAQFIIFPDSGARRIVEESTQEFSDLVHRPLGLRINNRLRKTQIGLTWETPGSVDWLEYTAR